MKMRNKVTRIDRTWSIVVGLAGGLLLIFSLAPVLLSGRNSSSISQWRDTILQFTQFTGYLRLIFVSAMLIITAAGILGIVINIAKPYTGQKLMLWGGIASLLLLLALWLGLLDVQVIFFGSTDIGSHLIWDSSWGFATWSVSRKLLQVFGGGWLKPAFIGAILLSLTSLPRLWSRLS
jgi:hypothetical protein